MVKKVKREKSDEFNNKYHGYFLKHVEEGEADGRGDDAAKAMIEAAKKGDMAVVRKQLKAGVAVDAKVGREK